MRDFPSCFGENGIQVADSSFSNTSKNAQNLVTCVYQCRIRGRSCLITIAWSRNLMGQGLSVGIDDSANQCLCKVDIKPWLFSKRKGSKSLEAYSCKIDIYWDLSSVKFGSGPEPLEGFYVAVVVDRQMVLILGDMRKEAFKKTGATPIPSKVVFVAKREHVFGKKVFCTKAQFCNNGQIHDLVIECDTIGVSDPCLLVRVDCKTVMQVKRLRWKFRGNHTILVDGLAIEVFWDVHNWLFGASVGNAVFMFQTCTSAEKLWSSQPLSDPNVLPCSFSQRFLDSKSQNPGVLVISSNLGSRSTGLVYVWVAKWTTGNGALVNLERKLKTAYCLESHPVTVIGRHAHRLNDSRLLTVLHAQSPYFDIAGMKACCNSLHSILESSGC
ncbi:hypothetical protein SADUNF_Sadunf05G0029600 [Salix dunnii]|uniref:DUF868 domain-containing protein n=1 Tax=Salix dunnii TaxID=1413687 RepID=A0A835MWP9_9ROSI|nr:hypothetical protein SADUNF_Sadunf05G0029600 [Salix dunnii]